VWVEAAISANTFVDVVRGDKSSCLTVALDARGVGFPVLAKRRRKKRPEAVDCGFLVTSCLHDGAKLR